MKFSFPGQRGFLRLAAAGVCAVVLAGCASGVKHKDMEAVMPNMKPGEGRIYFFRTPSMGGAAIQPDIRLNGDVVGASKPGGFFFVDRPAGSYTAATTSETEKSASFVLEAGETKYLRTTPSIGILVWRIAIGLETPERARAELPSLSYTGTPLGEKQVIK